MTQPAPLRRLRLNLRIAGLILLLIAIISISAIATDILSPRNRNPAAPAPHH
jgi:hypothetical protein